MKNINLSLFLWSICIIVLTGCTKLLEEHPKAIATTNFYNTPDEVATALNSIYTPLRASNSLGGNYPAMMECLPDYGYGRGSWAPNSEYDGLNATNKARMADVWDKIYQSIRNANIVIKNLPNAKNISEEKKAEFMAEAKFLRAFDYFVLVRSWGGVPLRDIDNMGKIDVPRSTSKQTYEMILDDATFAENNLPDEPRLIGAPSKWAAKTLLADIYLWLKRYNDARSEALAVINSHKYSLVTVKTPNDFLKLYGPDVVTTPEEIFYLKFNHQDGFWFGMFAHHPGSGYIGDRGYYGHYTLTTNSVIAGWDKNDLRRQYDFYPWDIGLGPNTLLYKKFIDPEATGNPSEDYTLYRYADVLIMFALADNEVNKGPTKLGVEYLNHVHRRAYGYDPDSPSPVDYRLSDYDYETFLDLIIKEEGYEDCYEGKRWLFLVCIGKAKGVIKKVKGIEIKDKTFLFPIPVTETNYNHAIDPKTDQNPGY